MKKQSLLLLSGALALGLLAGCGGKTVNYGDANAVETLNEDWGSTDLQTTAETLTESLLNSRYISQAVNPPKVRLRQVKNQTDEHIDTKQITDKIRIKLLKSGSVRFLADDENMDQVMKERDFTEAATTRGQNKLMTDTDYIVTGNVRSIKKSTKKQADVYYEITMELVDPQSGEIVWADEKEIRKTTTKSTFGW